MAALLMQKHTLTLEVYPIVTPLRELLNFAFADTENDLITPSARLRGGSRRHGKKSPPSSYRFIFGERS